MPNILVIDDDPLFLELVQATLAQHNLVCAQDQASAFAALQQATPDLIILDIHIDTTDGYQVCQEIRKQHRDLPILFISSNNTLESRLQAYDAGGQDFLAKPYQKQELNYKVEVLTSRHLRQQNLQDEIQNSASLIHNIQKDAASLQTINRFIQSCMHCKDLATLHTIFFIALKELNTSGVLAIQGDHAQAQSSDTAATRLELEILSMSHDLPRIHRFGNDRALFKWDRAVLLIRELGPLIDVLAILMDSLEVVLAAIETENHLLENISQLEQANDESHRQVGTLINDMTLSLQDSMITLGLVSDLSSEEEQTIRDIISDYAERIQENMATQHQHSQQIRRLVNELRAPSDSIQQLLQHAQNNDSHSDAVELF